RRIRARRSSRSRPMWFERLIVYDDRAPAGAALNMALDEALLELSSAPVLRFYRWERPALSFGYFGKFADVADETRELVRRWTGGGIVPHGEDLTYSLITPASHPAFAQGPPAVYAALHAAIREALRAENLQVELATAAALKISDACFANPVRDDLLLDGRKIAGAAQRRTRAGFLQQGSIQIPQLPQAFRERFACALSPALETREIPASVHARAAVLAAQKYATDAWLRRC
ncbi:MAG: lipoate--protein ligase family protein, partial [Chthoniobacterales bacterium]